MLQAGLKSGREEQPVSLGDFAQYVDDYTPDETQVQNLYDTMSKQISLIRKVRKYTNDYGTFERPTLEYVFMQLAVNLATRSTCARNKVGAVFTDTAMTKVYCVGYNGDEIGGKNQCESLEAGRCGCIHAEINALTKNNFDITGCTCFVTLSPCVVCAKVLVNRQISRLVYLDDYRDPSGLDVLKRHGIEIVHYNDL